MAKEKAQSETADQATIEEAVAGLDEETKTSLVPVLQKLPLAIVETVSDLLAEMNPNQEGLEEMEGGWSQPFIKIRQAMSSDYPKGIEMGDLYTDDGDKLENFEFVPLYMYPSHTKFSEDNNVDCYSEDTIHSADGILCKECPDEPFKNNEKTDCNKYFNVFLFDRNFKRMYRLNLGKTSYRTGSKLRKFMKGSGRYPWKKIYQLETNENQRKGGGTYYTYAIKPTGELIEDEALLEVSRIFKNQIIVARTSLKERLSERRQHADKVAADMAAGSGAAVSSTEENKEPDFSNGSL